MLTTLAAAIISGGFVFAAAIVNGRAQRRTRVAVEGVHDEVRTNHGRRAGEYLEDISQVKTDLNSLATTFAKHVDSDAEQFRIVTQGLEELKQRG